MVPHSRKLLVLAAALAALMVSVVAPGRASLASVLGSGRHVAGTSVAAATLTAASAAVTDPRDETKVPHYFGPYPNWANSPQVLADAVVTISLGTPTPVSYGNPLTERAYATDYATPPGNLGPVFVVLPNAELPAGTLRHFQIWNQGSAAGSPTPSAGDLFHAYVLRPDRRANEYTVVYDSGQLTVPAPAVAAGEVATFPVRPGSRCRRVTSSASTVRGFPVDTGVATNHDTFSYPATADPPLATNVAPAVDATVTFGVDRLPDLPSQDRTYSFAAHRHADRHRPGNRCGGDGDRRPEDWRHLGRHRHQPGQRLPHPAERSRSSRPGITPTSPASATAQISTGVITSVTVDEVGLRLHRPDRHLHRRQPDDAGNRLVASGGVDDVTARLTAALATRSSRS